MTVRFQRIERIGNGYYGLSDSIKSASQSVLSVEVMLSRHLLTERFQRIERMETDTTDYQFLLNQLPNQFYPLKSCYGATNVRTHSSRRKWHAPLAPQP